MEFQVIEHYLIVIILFITLTYDAKSVFYQFSF
jgi:hypothetical protein